MPQESRETNNTPELPVAAYTMLDRMQTMAVETAR